MPESFMREVLDRLDHLVDKTDTIAVRAENASINSAKARTGNKILTVAVVIVAFAVVFAVVAVARANDAAQQAKTAAGQAKELAAQQEVDRELSRLTSCQSRNSAQEAARQGVALALNNFINEIALELPNSVEAIERIRVNTFRGLPTFEGIDTDCNLDGVYTSADYATIMPPFPDGPVTVPDSAPPIETVPSTTTTTTTTQPGG